MSHKRYITNGSDSMSKTNLTKRSASINVRINNPVSNSQPVSPFCRQLPGIKLAQPAVSQFGP
jgi:hypothetical protein